MPSSRPRGRPRTDPAGPLRDLRLMLSPATYAALEAAAQAAALPLAAYARSVLVGALNGSIVGRDTAWDEGFTAGRDGALRPPNPYHTPLKIQ